MNSYVVFLEAVVCRAVDIACDTFELSNYILMISSNMPVFICSKRERFFAHLTYELKLKINQYLVNYINKVNVLPAWYLQTSDQQNVNKHCPQLTQSVKCV